MDQVFRCSPVTSDVSRSQGNLQDSDDRAIYDSNKDGGSYIPFKLGDVIRA